MNEGRRWKSKLWSEQGRAELEKLASAPWASRRRHELLELPDRMNPAIEELLIGTPERHDCGKQIGDYMGMIPPEESRGGKQ
jgi:transposase